MVIKNFCFVWLMSFLVGQNQPSYLSIMTVEQILRTDVVTSFKRRYQTSANISCLQSKFPKSSRLHPASHVPLTLSLRGWWKRHQRDLLTSSSRLLTLPLKLVLLQTSSSLLMLRQLLKKTSLDPESLNNYRPISQLPFISKVLEKVVADLLCKYLKDNDLFENLQSAYRPGHSVKTALVRVTNNILIALGPLDKKQMVLLVLLDLSAAFDTVDHELLLMRMSHRLESLGNALKWFRSYPTLRSQVVVLSDSSSEQQYIECGVPQGSVLGPILFTTYTSPLGDIARRVGLSYHLYADNTKLYVAFKPGPTDQVCCQQIQDCLVAMQEWMNSNFLKQ